MTKFQYPKVQLLISGKWCDASTGKTLDIIDPATEEVIGTAASASRDDLERAAQSVAKGFKTWSAMSAYDRSKIMRKAAALLRERVDHISWLMTREQGKPIAESKVETLSAADTIEWFAEESRRAYGQIVPARASNISQMAIRRPIGPIAAFTPWNFPINQIARKLGAALAAGCSMIVKAPDETPASPAAFIQCFLDAGIPDDVIAFVCGVPAEISGFLIPHPVIEKISFTGSTVVGKSLAGLAVQHMKKSTMELGGHAPVLVFDDADIDLAVSTMIASKFRNAGQVCISPTRFLIQEGVYQTFLDKFVKAVKALKVGNGLEEGVVVGPVANERRIPAMNEMISDAVAKGGKLVTGGKRIGTKGYFFEPTVLADVPITAEIMNEEPFGPVAIINSFKTLDDAINEANRLRYGLASYAFTKSAVTVHALGTRINAGMTAINHTALGIPEIPFGGVKDSGYGTEGGSEAINDYLDLKIVTVAV